uniref:Ycf36 n=2 Tax=Grateloupia TaxID=31454 RepID=A0A6F8UP46_9FLOR|nr:Ycf36 [Grateloupia filicina]AWD77350.1 Ycf36 [Grateloupia filicina]BCB15046.1 Ycf36 [Grateloupia asiatica]
MRQIKKNVLFSFEQYYMCISKKTCPVPFDQQPLNEYFSLKTSWFFAWSTLNNYEYVKQIFYIFCFFFVLFMPFVWSIVYNYNFPQILILDTIIVNIILILIFIRLYLGWSYIIKRLVSATIFYEESGWYDGQIWIKSAESLTKDRLIGLYEVTPFIKRIQSSLIISSLLMILENLLYFFTK